MVVGYLPEGCVLSHFPREERAVPVSGLLPPSPFSSPRPACYYSISYPLLVQMFCFNCQLNVDSSLFTFRVNFALLETVHVLMLTR